MGWDLTAIGLRHDLPVDDIYATAEIMANRMNKNIRIVIVSEYAYDERTNTVSKPKNSNSLIELDRLKINGSKEYVNMELVNYQAKKIISKVGIEKLKTARFADEDAEYILQKNIDCDSVIDIDSNRIYKENVFLHYDADIRWFSFEDAFHEGNQRENVIRRIQTEVRNKALLFGCRECLIFPDQGPTELIMDHVDLSSNELLHYIDEYEYITEYEEDLDYWQKVRNQAKHIRFDDFFKGKLSFEGDQMIDVIVL